MVSYQTEENVVRKTRRKMGLPVIALLVGICVGCITGERLFLLALNKKINHGTSTVRWRDFETFVPIPSTINGTTSDQNTRDEASGLKNILKRVAPDGNVLIAISNFNLAMEGSLLVWLDCVQRVGIKNWLLVAIDESLKEFCESNDLNYYYRPTSVFKSQEHTGDNHAISALKYEIIKEFLSLGWNVFLSDVDVVILKDPFVFLHYDSDIEGMTDGYDDGTAYGSIFGIDDPSMGWSRYAQGFSHMALNSGLFYIQANERTILLMERIASILRKEAAWDQTVWNTQIFLLSHGEYKSPQVSIRVMEYNRFMNSKVLFKYVRHLPRSKQPEPVLVHVNYHPNKQERMRALILYYFEHDENALKSFPDGSEKNK